VPIQVIRFGVGHRRPDGPPGTRGITGQVIHSDARGVIAELAFARGGLIEPHSNPNTTYFVVIEGGGWVVVDGERLRVAAGEAVVWPPGVPHGAWTEHGPMRAFVVELAGADDSLAGVLPGEAGAIEPGSTPYGAEARAEGRLADRPVPPERVDRSQGEPL
jgi:quercetin dioxygenase-like cupin family protein